MHLQFQHIEPHPLLKGYIEKMWLFESSGRIPSEDIKLIVPNGRVKLVVAYRNGIVSSMEGRAYFSREDSIAITGLVDVPLTLDTDENITTGSIGIEFSPKGAYRFLRLNLSNINNEICQIEDILGKEGRQLQERIAARTSTGEKIALLQQFLLQQLYRTGEDAVFEFCVKEIKASNGKISIHELERKTGYSRRWLHMKFLERVGVGPKSLSSILRFRHYYQAWVSGETTYFQKTDFYDSYFDQSHFIKEFRRFTGLTPTRMEKTTNDFGRKFYTA